MMRLFNKRLKTSFFIAVFMRKNKDVTIYAFSDIYLS